jgi:tetratricopeptide (TPR) repeat protein
MMNHFFISYSTADARDFALKLCDELTAGPPVIPAWLDKRELKPGSDWDDQIVEAIKTCAGLVFVMSRDSVDSDSITKMEWSRALKYKKPLIPLLLHKDAEMPFQLEGRQYIDFSGDFDTGLAKLRKHIQWLDSPKGLLLGLRYRLKDAQRDLRRTEDPLQIKRIRDDIEDLKRETGLQEQVAADPDAAKKRVQENIDRGLERERLPEKPVGGRSYSKFINPPPGIAPTYFQDRHLETKLMGDFLKNDAERLMTVVGRAGIGKTAMVCRLLKALESGCLPDDGGALSIDGIVYLGEIGVHKVNFPHLFADLGRLLPDDTAKELDAVYKEARTDTGDKMRALLTAFPRGRVVVLLDNFESKLDPETRDVADAELDEALRALLDFQHHGVKIIVTTRIAPRNLALVQPGRQYTLNLDQGLESPYAENILREMDKDGKLGLAEAPAGLLDLARQRTLGFPRALEALVAILCADRETTLQDILADTEKLLPQYVVEKLVGEAFSRLDPRAQAVMQALAVYGRSVTAAAVDYLLQPFFPGLDSAPVLNRLVNMQLVRKDVGHYYLHPVDCEYALSRVPEGKETDRDETGTPLFTRFALLHRGAGYFKKARKPRPDWKNIADLAPQLAEIDLRFAGKDFDTAADVLLGIDFDYLLLWGHYRLMVDLHEGLQGKIGDPLLKQVSVGNLGAAYYSMGQYRKAISCYEQALSKARERKDRGDEGACLGNLGTAYKNMGQYRKTISYYEQALKIARERKDSRNEGVWLGNLGSTYWSMGQYQKAISYYEQALKSAREKKDRRNEGAWLGNLGSCYSVLGQTLRAIDFYQQALKIDREIGDRQMEAIDLGNLGNCFADLGETDRTIEYFELALVIAREIGARSTEAINLTNLGDVLLDKDKSDEAVVHYNQSINIADEIGNVQEQNEARYGLALARLYSGNLSQARSTIEEARKYNFPRNNHQVQALLGLILHRQGLHKQAQEAFSAAINESNTLLGHAEKNYAALDCKALSLCGLALCETEKKLLHVEEAIKTYRAARAIDRDPGYVKGVLRLFDELAKEDKEGILLKVRSIFAG